MKIKIKQHLVTKVPIFGGKGFINRNARSGQVWQYQQWIKDEKKYIRISLKTTDREIATELAEKKFTETVGQIYSGEKIFSVSAQELVEKYLEALQRRVALDSIRATFVTTIKSHLKWYLAFVGHSTKTQGLKAEKFKNFVDYRRQQNSKIRLRSVSDCQKAISAMYGWAIEEGLLSQKSFPKWSEFRIPIAEGKRQGIEIDDIRKIAAVSRWWHKKSITEQSKYERQHLHNFIVIQSWYGFRTGEVRSLCWNDVKFRSDGHAEVRIREENTKHGKGRKCLGRADIFRRIQSYSKYTSATDHVFSSFASGKKWQTKAFYSKWRELVHEIKKKYPAYNTEKSLYDLRHFYISSRLRAGDSPWLISKYCGTSAEMIAKHYDHVSDEQVSKKILSKRMKFVGDDVIGVMTNGGADDDDER